MALALIFKSIGMSYLAGSTSGFGSVAAQAKSRGVSLGNYNNLQVQAISNLAGSVQISDLKDLERQMREVAPKLYQKLRRDIKRLGVPARDEVRKAFKQVNPSGPLGAPKRPGRTFDKMATSELGRLSWYSSRIMTKSKAIEAEYKNRNAKRDFQKIKSGADGTLSLVRVKIAAPAYIVADMAGKSMRAARRTGTLSREYTINLFGKGQVVRRHSIDGDNVENWIRQLNSQASNRGQNAPSRYAWPALQDHMPEYRANTSKLLNETIRQLNQRMQ